MSSLATSPYHGRVGAASAGGVPLLLVPVGPAPSPVSSFTRLNISKSHGLYSLTVHPLPDMGVGNVRAPTIPRHLLAARHRQVGRTLTTQPRSLGVATGL